MSTSDDADRPGRGLGGQAVGADPAARRAAQPGAAGRLRGVPRAGGRAAWSTSRPGARSPRCTAPVWREWPEELQDPRVGRGGRGPGRARRPGRLLLLAAVGRRRAARRRAAAGRRGRDGARASCTTSRSACTPDGADTWALQDVMARGVSVGAPPDAFNQVRARTGRSRRGGRTGWPRPGYAPYRDMLRTVLRHAGGVRVDHVLGLFRLWWVPEGRPPAEGTYVRYDHEALVGILALEAQRAGAVVVGEDLGTVEPWVRDYLAERGVLGTSILWFERDYEAGVAAAARAVARAVPRLGHHPRPAADGRLPRRRAHPDPGRARAAHPPGRGGAAGRRGRPRVLARRCSSSAAGSRPDAEHDVRGRRRSPCTGRWPPRRAACSASR